MDKPIVILFYIVICLYFYFVICLYNYLSILNSNSLFINTFSIAEIANKCRKCTLKCL